MLRSLLKPLVIAITLGGFILSANSPASSENSIRFGIMALKPYGFIDNKKQPHGDLYEMAQAILKQGNFQGKVVIAPLNRLMHSILVDKVLDCSIFGTVPFVAENYHLVESTGIYVVFGILPRKGVVIKKYKDLKNIRIGHPSGVKIGGDYDNDKRLKRVLAKNYEGGMLMLKHKRFDAIAGVIGTLKYNGKKHALQEDFYDTPYITQRYPMAVACRPDFNNQEVLQKLKTTVRVIRESGELRRIFESYRNN